jgi:adenylosuccinate lyase
VVISPIDGRYADDIHSFFFERFSEEGMLLTKCRIEVDYLFLLEDAGFIKITDIERETLESLFGMSEVTVDAIKRIEHTTKHDVKAVEICIAQAVPRLANWVHFGLTSEDINSVAYALTLRDHLKTVLLPQIKNLLHKLCFLSIKHADDIFPAHTHGQMASPTTAGKEFCVFVSSLTHLYAGLKKHMFLAKMNGAVGNYSALHAAFPSHNWVDTLGEFIQRYDLLPEQATTQVSSRLQIAKYFSDIILLNNVVNKLNCDMWEYLSRGYFMQYTDVEQVGSSVMPHKVNPIDFENSEGNLLTSNGMLTTINNKICSTRMQRDLSDSAVMRNTGVALAHSYLAIRRTIRGLDRVTLNKDKCAAEVDANPDIMLEAVQTILRTTDMEKPYFVCKGLVGKSKQELLEWVKTLPVSDEVKDKLLPTISQPQVGWSSVIAKTIASEVMENVL